MSSEKNSMERLLEQIEASNSEVTNDNSRVDKKTAQVSISNKTFGKVEIPFKIINTPIDYFKIPVDRLSEAGYNVKLTKLSLAERRMNLETDLKELNFKEKETVVLNIPTGRGKTTICYELIKKYASKNYMVVVCSPFTKLVEKDFAELSKFDGLKVRNYMQLDELPHEDLEGLPAFVDAGDIHIMTVNCLLKNPGEDRFEQSALKHNYLRLIQSRSRRLNKKIVLFIDEIHESVHNFKNELLPAIFEWHGLIEKCFIASATFTEATIPIVKCIALLTEKRIHVLEADRTKDHKQASLHLHILQDSYSSGYLIPLTELKDIIAKNKNRPIHILAGYKSIVNTLTNKKLPADISTYNEDIIKSVRGLKMNILTSDTDDVFDELKNNIGTNFKTGVNITNSSALYIILIPPIKSIENQYGIFSDGIPSISQALARVRNGGDIHVFMLSPECMIEETASHTAKERATALNMPSVNRYQFNDAYNKIMEAYEGGKKKIQAGIEALRVVNPEYKYSTLDEFIVNKGQSLITKNFESFGKSLAPYILWAASNNQFCNATLTSINYFGKLFNFVDLDAERNDEELLAGISSESIAAAQKAVTVKEGFDAIKQGAKIATQLHLLPDDSLEVRIRPSMYIYNGEERTFSEINEIPKFNQLVLSASESLRTKDLSDVTKRVYINRMIIESQTQQSELHSIYKELGEVKDEFVKLSKEVIVQRIKGEFLWPIKADVQFNKEFVEKCFDVILRLKKTDYMLGTVVFSFLKNVAGEFPIIQDEIEKRRKEIITAFEDLWLNIDLGQTGRVTFKGTKYYKLFN
jgi:hypothetical protein